MKLKEIQRSNNAMHVSHIDAKRCLYLYIFHNTTGTLNQPLFNASYSIMHKIWSSIWFYLRWKDKEYLFLQGDKIGNSICSYLRWKDMEYLSLQGDKIRNSICSYLRWKDMEYFSLPKVKRYGVVFVFTQGEKIYTICSYLRWKDME